MRLLEILPTTMSDFNERSAYPSPDEFKVMRPEYTETEDGFVRASITITPFRVTGESTTRPGARRAALYDAEKTYRSYHPSYRIDSPFPDEFVDTDGATWKRVPPMHRDKLGDYSFVPAGESADDEDYADIEQMLSWDIRPEGQAAEADEE